MANGKWQMANVKRRSCRRSPLSFTLCRLPSAISHLPFTICHAVSRSLKQSIALTLVAAMVLTLPGTTAWADYQKLGLDTGKTSAPNNYQTSPNNPSNYSAPIEYSDAAKLATNLAAAGGLANMVERFSNQQAGPIGSFGWVNGSGNVTHPDVATNVAFGDELVTWKGADGLPQNGTMNAFMEMQWSEISTEMTNNWLDSMRAARVEGMDQIKYALDKAEYDASVKAYNKALADAAAEQQKDYEKAYNQMVHGGGPAASVDSLQYLSDQLKSQARALLYQANRYWVKWQEEAFELDYRLNHNVSNLDKRTIYGANDQVKNLINGTSSDSANGKQPGWRPLTKDIADTETIKSQAKKEYDRLSALDRQMPGKGFGKDAAAQLKKFEDAKTKLVSLNNDLAVINRQLCGASAKYQIPKGMTTGACQGTSPGLSWHDPKAIQGNGLLAYQKYLTDRLTDVTKYADNVRLNYLDPASKALGGNKDYSHDLKMTWDPDDKSNKKLIEASILLHNDENYFKTNADNDSLARLNPAPKPAPPPEKDDFKDVLNQVKRLIPGITTDPKEAQASQAKVSLIEQRNAEYQEKFGAQNTEYQKLFGQRANLSDEDQKKLEQLMTAPYKGQPSPAYKRLQDVLAARAQADKLLQTLDKRMADAEKLMQTSPTASKGQYQILAALRCTPGRACNVGMNLQLANSLNNPFYKSPTDLYTMYTPSIMACATQNVVFGTCDVTGPVAWASNPVNPEYIPVEKLALRYANEMCGGAADCNVLKNYQLAMNPDNPYYVFPQALPAAIKFEGQMYELGSSDAQSANFAKNMAGPRQPNDPTASIIPAIYKDWIGYPSSQLDASLKSMQTYSTQQYSQISQAQDAYIAAAKAVSKDGMIPPNWSSLEPPKPFEDQSTFGAAMAKMESIPGIGLVADVDKMGVNLALKGAKGILAVGSGVFEAGLGFLGGDVVSGIGVDLSYLGFNQAGDYMKGVGLSNSMMFGRALADNQFWGGFYRTMTGSNLDSSSEDAVMHAVGLDGATFERDASGKLVVKAADGTAYQSFVSETLRDTANSIIGNSDGHIRAGEITVRDVVGSISPETYASQQIALSGGNPVVTALAWTFKAGYVLGDTVASMAPFGLITQLAVDGAKATEGAASFFGKAENAVLNGLVRTNQYVVGPMLQYSFATGVAGNVQTLFDSSKPWDVRLLATADIVGTIGGLTAAKGPQVDPAGKPISTTRSLLNETVSLGAQAGLTLVGGEIVGGVTGIGGAIGFGAAYGIENREAISKGIKDTVESQRTGYDNQVNRDIALQLAAGEKVDKIVVAQPGIAQSLSGARAPTMDQIKEIAGKPELLDNVLKTMAQSGDYADRALLNQMANGDVITLRPGFEKSTPDDLMRAANQAIFNERVRTGELTADQLNQLADGKSVKLSGNITLNGDLIDSKSIADARAVLTTGEIIPIKSGNMVVAESVDGKSGTVQLPEVTWGTKVVDAAAGSAGETFILPSGGEPSNLPLQARASEAGVAGMVGEEVAAMVKKAATPAAAMVADAVEAVSGKGPLPRQGAGLQIENLTGERALEGQTFGHGSIGGTQPLGDPSVNFRQRLDWAKGEVRKQGSGEPALQTLVAEPDGSGAGKGVLPEGSMRIQESPDEKGISHIRIERTTDPSIHSLEQTPIVAGIPKLTLDTSLSRVKTDVAELIGRELLPTELRDNSAPIEPPADPSRRAAENDINAAGEEAPSLLIESKPVTDSPVMEVVPEAAKIAQDLATLDPAAKLADAAVDELSRIISPTAAEKDTADMSFLDSRNEEMRSTANDSKIQGESGVAVGERAQEIGTLFTDALAEGKLKVITPDLGEERRQAYEDLQARKEKGQKLSDSQENSLKQYRENYLKGIQIHLDSDLAQTLQGKMSPEVVDHVMDLLFGKKGGDSGLLEQAHDQLALARGDKNSVNPFSLKWNELQSADTANRMGKGANLEAAVSGGKTLTCVRASLTALLKGSEGGGADGSLILLRSPTAVKGYQIPLTKTLAGVFGVEIKDVDGAPKANAWESVRNNIRNNRVINVGTWSEMTQLINEITEAQSPQVRASLREFQEWAKTAKVQIIIDEAHEFLGDMMEGIRGDGGRSIRSIYDDRPTVFEDLWKRVNESLDRNQIGNEKSDAPYRYSRDSENGPIVPTAELEAHLNPTGRYLSNDIRSALEAALSSPLRGGKFDAEVSIDANPDGRGILAPNSQTAGIQAERIIQNAPKLVFTAMLMRDMAREPGDAGYDPRLANFKYMLDGKTVDWENTKAGGKTLAAAGLFELLTFFRGGEVNLVSGTLTPLRTLVRVLTGNDIYTFGEIPSIRLSPDGKGVEFFNGDVPGKTQNIRVGYEFEDTFNGAFQRMADQSARVLIDRLGNEGGDPTSTQGRGQWIGTGDVNEDYAPFKNRLSNSLFDSAQADDSVRSLLLNEAQRVAGVLVDPSTEAGLRSAIDVVVDDRVVKVDERNVRQENYVDNQATAANKEGKIALVGPVGWVGVNVLGHEMEVMALDIQKSGKSMAEQLMARVNRQGADGFFMGGKATLYTSTTDMEARLADLAEKHGDQLTSIMQNVDVSGENPVVAAEKQARANELIKLIADFRDGKALSNDAKLYLTLHFNEALEISNAYKQAAERIYNQMLVRDTYREWLGNIADRLGTDNAVYKAAKEIYVNQVLDHSSELYSVFTTGERSSGPEILKSKFVNTVSQVEKLADLVGNNSALRGERDSFTRIFDVQGLKDARENYGQIDKAKISPENSVRALAARGGSIAKELVGLIKNMEGEILSGVATTHYMPQSLPMFARLQDSVGESVVAIPRDASLQSEHPVSDSNDVSRENLSRTDAGKEPSRQDQTISRANLATAERIRTQAQNDVYNYQRQGVTNVPAIVTLLANAPDAATVFNLARQFNAVSSPSTITEMNVAAAFVGGIQMAQSLQPQNVPSISGSALITQPSVGAKLSNAFQHLMSGGLISEYSMNYNRMRENGGAGRWNSFKMAVGQVMTQHVAPPLSLSSRAAATAQALTQTLASMGRLGNTSTAQPRLAIVAKALQQNLIALSFTGDPKITEALSPILNSAAKLKTSQAASSQIEQSINQAVSIALNAPRATVETGDGFSVEFSRRNGQSKATMRIDRATGLTGLKVLALSKLLAVPGVSVEFQVGAGVDAQRAQAIADMVGRIKAARADAPISVVQTNSTAAGRILSNVSLALRHPIAYAKAQSKARSEAAVRPVLELEQAISRIERLDQVEAMAKDAKMAEALKLDAKAIEGMTSQHRQGLDSALSLVQMSARQVQETIHAGLLNADHLTQPVRRLIADLARAAATPAEARRAIEDYLKQVTVDAQGKMTGPDNMPGRIHAVVLEDAVSPVVAMRQQLADALKGQPGAQPMLGRLDPAAAARAGRQLRQASPLRQENYANLPSDLERYRQDLLDILNAEQARVARVAGALHTQRPGKAKTQALVQQRGEGLAQVQHFVDAAYHQAPISVSQGIAQAISAQSEPAVNPDGLPLYLVVPDQVDYASLQAIRSFAKGVEVITNSVYQDYLKKAAEVTQAARRLALKPVLEEMLPSAPDQPVQNNASTGLAEAVQESAAQIAAPLKVIPIRSMSSNHAILERAAMIAGMGAIASIYQYFSFHGFVPDITAFLHPAQSADPSMLNAGFGSGVGGPVAFGGYLLLRYWDKVRQRYEELTPRARALGMIITNA